MGKEPTAERQLLDIIESQDKDPDKDLSADSNELSSAEVSKRKVPFFSFDVIKARIEFFSQRIKDIQTGAKPLDLDLSMDLINNVLVVIIVGMFVFLAYEITAKPYKFQKIPDLISKEKETLKKDIIKKEQKGIDFYLEKLNNRDIFSLTPVVEEVEVAEEVVQQAQIEIVLADLKLVGLSPDAGGGNSFIMVESQEDEITIFLEEGDDIEGVIVKEILYDRVVFTDGVEERELR